ncbi:MAG TPA: Ig-like domain-containing protein, partial [Gammaproteobacteria bacterium]|nr:Ig-like domain-containing protein [Gammaproteobacteria bacterium]
PRRTVAAGDYPLSAIAADVNGDGKTDIAVTNFRDDTVSVLENVTVPGPAATTVPSFAPAATPAAASPVFIAAADLNGDGKPELVTASDASPDITVLMNTTPAPTAAFGLAAKQDFDGLYDFGSVTAADINGDGRTDLVVSRVRGDHVSVLVNTTPPGAITSSFAGEQTFVTQPFTRDATAADVNGDGKMDLIVLAYNSVSVLLNTTTPGAETLSFVDNENDFVTGVDRLFSIRAGDVNGDSRVDLIISNPHSDAVTVLLNATAPGATTPSFAAAQDFTVGTDPAGATMADINGDGKLDLIAANRSDDSASVLLNNTVPGATTLSFAAKQDFTVGSYPASAMAADVNGDGRADLITVNQRSDSVSVRLNTTPGGATTLSFAEKLDFATEDNPFSVTAADVNGDGRTDLIAANYYSHSLSVLLNATVPGATTPSFAVKQDFTTGSVSQAVTAADINGDGRPDLITANAGDGTVSVLLNTQYATTTTPTSVTGAIHYSIPVASGVPASIDFGPQPLGGDAASQTFTLENTGNADLAVSFALSGPNTADFNVTDDCDGTLDAGASCTVTVTFEPSAAGARSATLTLTSNGADSPQAIALTGKGNRPPAATGESVSVHTGATVTGTLDATDAEDADLLFFIATAPAHGTVTITDTATGAYRYQAPAGYAGADAFTFQASDGLSSSNTASVAVTVTNAVPVASDGTLAVVKNQPKTGTFAATDADGDALTYSLAAEPDHGSVTIAGANFTYKPDTGYSGADSFTFKVNDGVTDSAAAAVTINVVNTAPVASSATLLVAKNMTKSGTLTASDADGDTLTFAKVSDPAHGALTLNADGSFTYTPASGYIGGDSFTFKANDGSVDSNVAAVTIAVTDNMPVGNPAVLTVHSNTPGEGVLTANDGNGDALRFALAAQAEHGTAVVEADGHFIYTPDTGYVGADAFTFTVSDGALSSAPATVSVTVADAAPLATDAELKVGKNRAAAGVLQAADADGDSLTFRKTANPKHGQAEVQPDGSFTYTPDKDYAGPDRFTFVANDGALDSAAATVAITVGNGAPVAKDGSLSVHFNTEGRGSLVAGDANGDALTYQLARDPEHGTATVKADGAYSYKPDKNFVGWDSFTFTASDGTADSKPAAIHVLVTDGMPVATNSHRTTTPGLRIYGQLQAADPDGDPLTYHVVLKPDHGEIALKPDGRYTYRPDAGFSGADSFRFRADDGALQSDPGVVGITVAPEAESGDSGGLGGLGWLGLLVLGGMAGRRRGKGD